MSANPFEILGLPVSFDVDASQLQRKLAQLAAEHHPDRFVDPLDQADAADRLSAINQAHRQIRDPLSRAQVMLKLLGKGVTLDEKALPPTLLMEMMEIREEMEEAIASSDQPTLDRLRQWASDQQTEHLQQLSSLLSQAQTTDGPEQARLIQQAQIELNTLRYFARMLEQMPPAS